MTGYRVDPAGVGAVMKAVLASFEPLGTAVGQLQGHAASAADGSSSAIVGSALMDAFGVIGAQVQDVQAKIPAVLHGTTEAGTAVIEGDEQMAGQIVGLATGALSEADVLRGMAHGGAQPR